MRRWCILSVAIAEATLSPHRTGRLLSALIALSGILFSFGLLLPMPEGTHRLPLFLINGLAVTVGVAGWYAPWARLRWTCYWVFVSGALGIIALSNGFGGFEPFSYAAYFTVVFVWVGIASPRWTSLLVAADRRCRLCRAAPGARPPGRGHVHGAVGAPGVAARCGVARLGGRHAASSRDHAAPGQRQRRPLAGGSHWPGSQRARRGRSSGQHRAGRLDSAGWRDRQRPAAGPGRGRPPSPSRRSRRRLAAGGAEHLRDQFSARLD